eukprot:2006028-Prorocentrum_lima.AAC.1
MAVRALTALGVPPARVPYDPTSDSFNDCRVRYLIKHIHANIQDQVAVALPPSAHLAHVAR